jgi:putative DNA primase/helicase
MSVSLADPADGVAVAGAASVEVAEVFVAANDNAPLSEHTDSEPAYLNVGHFTMNDRGLFWSGNGDQQQLSSPFEIVAETTDGKGEAWGRLLRWRDRSGRLHEWAMPLAMLAGDITDIKRRMLDGGVLIYQGQRSGEKFANYLMSVRPALVARCVNRTGWDDDVYVTPGRVFGSATDSLVVYQPDKAPTLPWQEVGDQLSWQNEVAKYAIGNSRLALAISAAFAGPLLSLVGEESGGFHFGGGSSSGKTTALRVSASVYGVPLRTWRTTANGAEALAAESNDAALYLDELSQVDGKVADELAYMLGNGTGKSRANQHGLARRTASWRTIILSTGEIGLAEKMGEVGKKPRAGQSVRLVEIPADAGSGHKLFERLHGFQDGDALATHLRTASESNHGTAIAAFLEAVVARREQLPEMIKNLRDVWISANVPAGADGQVKRVAARFALVAAAGEIASQLMILPWQEGEAGWAATRCFQSWLGKRGGIGALELTQGIKQVRAFIETHGSSRFSTWDDPTDARTLNRVGWRKKENGSWDYFVLPTAFREEVCKGHDATFISRAMLAEGMLKGCDDRPSRVVSIPGHGKMRVYHVTSEILSSDSSEAA